MIYYVFFVVIFVPFPMPQHQMKVAKFWNTTKKVCQDRWSYILVEFGYITLINTLSWIHFHFDSGIHIINPWSQVLEFVNLVQ